MGVDIEWFRENEHALIGRFPFKHGVNLRTMLIMISILITLAITLTIALTVKKRGGEVTCIPPSRNRTAREH